MLLSGINKIFGGLILPLMQFSVFRISWSILFANAKTTQDEDGAWYNYLEGTEKYQFLYSEDETDIYTLVVYFPENYKDATDYADNIENIEVEILSKQIID